MNNIDRIIADYIRRFKPSAIAFNESFKNLSSLSEAVSKAAMAQREDEKRHSHQYRIPIIALIESKRRLIENINQLTQLTTFEDLFLTIEKLISPIKGIGELTVYDTAARVGAYLKLSPQKVYLHAGTRKGARNLGIKTNGKFLSLDSLPISFRELPAQDIEDILCIYKDHFKSDEESPSTIESRCFRKPKAKRC